MAMGRERTRKKKEKKKKKKKKKKRNMNNLQKKGGILSVSGRDEDNIIISSIGSAMNEKDSSVHPQENSSDEEVDDDGDSGDSDETESHVDAIDASIAASAAAADVVNELAAAHEHEMAEWKQVHLSLQSLSDAHMAALSDITELTKTHTEQLDKAHKKIEELERENAKLLIANGPPTSLMPDFVVGRISNDALNATEGEKNKMGEANGADVKVSTTETKKSTEG